MFRTIFTKSLRGYRTAILGWGIGIGLLIFFYYPTVTSALSGATPAQLQQLVQQFRFFGETLALTTPGGYVTFKIMGSLPLVLGIWAVLAGARMTRGEEESGALDILLSTPQSRLSIVVQKLLALAAATGLISLLIGLLILAGMASAKTTVDPAHALLAGVNVGITVFLFGALALLLAQFLSRSAAAGLAGGLMALFYVLEGTGRAVDGLSGLRPISPFYYYDRNLPLVPGYAINWGALAVLVALCVIVAGAAVPLFLRRDVGRSVLADVEIGRREAGAAKPVGQVIAQAAHDVWVRGVGVQALRRQGAAMSWWTISLAVVAGYLVLIAKTTEKQLQDLVGSSSFFKQLFSGTNLSTNSGFLSVLVFGYIPLLLPLFSGIIAYRWATDLDKGRLELVLSTPHSRWRVMLERYTAVVVAAVTATLGIWLAIVLCAQAAGFAIDGGRVAEAAIGMLPLALITASLVFALAGLLPPAAVIGIMAVFLAVSFLADLLRTALNLPSWALNFSMFHQYGSPVLDGLNWGAFVGMLVAALALLALGGWQFSARDVDRGAIQEG
ncbi:MAG: ABC transporter permease subunit [Ktedonobacterales bacterium]